MAAASTGRTGQNDRVTITEADRERVRRRYPKQRFSPAVLAVLGLVVLALAASYQQLAQYPAVAGALRGMGAVAAGLILAMALKMLGTLRGNVLGPALCTALGLGTLTAIAVFRVPLAWVVIGLGLGGWGLARWRIALRDAAAARAKDVPTDVPPKPPAPTAGRDPGAPR